MKEKLEVIGEALDYIGNSSWDTCIVSKAAKTRKVLDSLIAELESDELVEKVARGLCSMHYDLYEEGMNTQPKSEYIGYLWDGWRIEAETAINAIKGI